MTSSRHSLIALLAIVSTTISTADETTLVVTSSTPDVNVEVRKSDRYTIRLPGLHYEFQLELNCEAGYAPETVLLSIADTRKRFSAEDLNAESAASISVKIPATQIAPLSVEGFCLASESDDSRESEQVTVRGILSAQASLLCSGEDDQRLTYASRSLDVMLSCNVETME